MEQKSWNKAKRWLLWLGGGMIILCVAAGGFWYWINITPQVKIPTPVMPNPNGYDYFLRAGAAYVPDKKGVDEVTDATFVRGKQYSIAAKEDWLKQNAKALSLLREGLKYPVLHPPTQPPYDPDPGLFQFRDLAWALVVESHVQAAHGEWRGAANSTLDGLKFGHGIPRGGQLIVGLVSNAVQVISLRELLLLLPHLDAATSRQTAARLERLYDGRFPYFKIIQQEKWTQQTDLLEMMSKRDWPQLFLGILNEPALGLSWLKKNEMLFTSKRTVMNDYTKEMDAYIANGRLPYRKMQSVPASGDPFAEFFISVSNDTRWNWTRTETINTLTMTMLALRAFWLEKGHYPATLKELVPEYLKKVPIDPFIGYAPLRYKLQGKKYLLWSIGSDGVDNHGAPVINSDKQGSSRYFFRSPDSKGDVVAGINVP